MFEAARLRRTTGQGTLLFVDEIHRFNRSQQDAFLPFMEDGTVTLVGATTENPSFELNAALLSRARVLSFRSLDEAAIASSAGAGRGGGGPAAAARRRRRAAALVGMADGDGRAALTLAEEIWRAAEPDETFDPAGLPAIVQRRAPLYDKSQDGHYNLISRAAQERCAARTPTRRSTISPACWTPGEDPLYLGRRLVRMAVEDIGLADPQALAVCQRRQGRLRLPRLAGRRTGAGAGDRLSRHGAEIERALYGLQGGDSARRRKAARCCRPRSSSTRRPS